MSNVMIIEAMILMFVAGVYFGSLFPRPTQRGDK